LAALALVAATTVRADETEPGNTVQSYPARTTSK
jgi:hypothetical protein